ncbi:alpha/beta fold hydrolase [Lacticaseibacillus brantae]|uniref:2-hydroxy-6-ketonona-24-dienedioic acid hydrolase n=1 Tax=Lacticaseibacillus brantae DSM 23927 TaxID=1423727 RepID=A0A0R2B5U4_9LACO|nr:alpha/beta hydrolase [Lacticaseibacillus brantae]KRM71430.1 2-hydroxy-6-ketonona-24-dienedioic acid hydrolase [Lacticaseibacillus brantae DSM 23927]
MAYQQPRLDHDSAAFKAAAQAEQELLRAYDLEETEHWFTYEKENLRLRVSEIGTGAPVLVVPGNTGDMFPFIPLIAQMKENKFFLFNRPGGGLSDGMNHQKVDIRPFIIDLFDHLLDELHLDKVTIMAHSMGCHWTLWYAMARPERIEKLVLIGNPGRVMLGKTPLPLKLMVMPVVGEFAVKKMVPKDYDHALNGLKMMGTSEQAMNGLPKAFRECYYRFQNLPYYQESTLSLLRTFNANSTNEIEANELANLNFPVEMIWGVNDTFATVDKGKEIAAAFPNCQFQLIQNAGHMPWLDQPAQVGQLTSDFIA